MNMADLQRLSPSELFTPKELRIHTGDIEQMTSYLKEPDIKLASTQEKNIMLVSELEKVQDEVERSHNQIASHMKLISELKGTNSSLSCQIKAFAREPSSAELENLRKQVEVKELQLTEMAHVVQQQERTIQALSSNSQVSCEQLENLQIELQTKAAELDLLQLKLKKSEKSLESLILRQTSEGDLLLELEHLKSDNQRLITLVDNKELTQHIADSHYAPQKKFKAKDERETWLPKAAVKILDSYNEHLTEDVLHHLLLELNTYWLDKGKRTLLKQKQQSETKVLDLKRQMFMRQPYDSVNSQKIIARLRAELKAKNKELAGLTEELSKLSKKSPGINQIESTMRVLKQIQEENQNCVRENKILKLKLLTQKGDKEPLPQFAQGVDWLGGKVLNESARVHQLVSGILNDFSASKDAVAQERLLGRIEYIVKDFGDNIGVLVSSGVTNE